MARKGENIYKRKDGRYEGRYIRGRDENGRIRWGYVYGRELRQVRKQVALLRAEYMQFNNPIGFTGGTLELWAQHWLQVVTRPHIKDSTYQGYQHILQKHIVPALGKRKLREIKREDIQAFADELCNTCAPSTVRGICRLLRSLLKAAVVCGLLAVTPYTGIREPKLKTQRPRVLTQHEQQRLETMALQSDAHEVTVMLYTGLRLGELCALRWQDVDFTENMLRVRSTLQRMATGEGKAKTHMVFGTPKSETSVRDVPLPAVARSTLQQLYRETRPNPQDFVFKGTRGGYLDPRTLQSRFKRLCRHVNIQGAHMHTLRHTYATRCRELDIGYETLAELMGHSSPQVTIQFYGHCTLEHKKESVRLLDRIA